MSSSNVQYQKLHSNALIISFLYSSVVFSHTFCLYQFLEGGKCEVEKNYSRGQVTCNVCPNSNDKYKIKTDDNISNRRSGDWKYDDDSFDRSLPGNVHDVTGPDWKWKNLYGISDLEQSNRWHHSTLVSGKSPQRAIERIKYRTIVCISKERTFPRICYGSRAAK